MGECIGWGSGGREGGNNCMMEVWVGLGGGGGGGFVSSSFPSLKS